MTLAELNQRVARAREGAADAGQHKEFALGDGLRVRAYPSGKASFMYRFRAPGSNRLRPMTLTAIGRRVTKADLAAVEELHRAAKQQRANAVDPLDKRHEARRKAAEDATRTKTEAAEKAFTVSTLARDYLDAVCETKRSWKEDKRILNKYVLPFLGDKPVGQITHKDVKRVLKYLDKTPVMRDRTLACTKAAWNWHNPIGTNPWAAEKIPQRPPRDYVLSVDELHALIQRLNENQGMARDIVKLILLTGLRRQEVSSASKQEFEGDQWRIPAERMKGERTHIVLLSKQAEALVKRILASQESEWLFPSPRTTGPISREYGYKWLKQGGANYTLHDLRRTLSSHLGESLVPDAVIDRVLAHAKIGVVRYYNHARLTDPARKAWQAWADYLDLMARGR